MQRSSNISALKIFPGRACSLTDPLCVSGRIRVRLPSVTDARDSHVAMGTCSHGCQRKAHVRTSPGSPAPRRSSRLTKCFVRCCWSNVPDTEILETSSPLQQIINNNQDRMATATNAFRSPPSARAKELAARIRLLRVTGRPGHLHQRRTQPADYPWSCDRFPLTRTFVVARRHPHPRTQVGRRWELVHVRADFRQDVLGGESARRCREPLPAEARLYHRPRQTPAIRSLTRAIQISNCVTSSRNNRSRKRWWSVTRPCKATFKTGILARIFRLANSAVAALGAAWANTVDIRRDSAPCATRYRSMEVRDDGQ